MAAIPSLAGVKNPAPAPVLSADLIDDLQRLQKSAQRITSILDLDQLIDGVVQEMTESFGCLEASIFLHDEERGDMVMQGVCGCTVHEKGHRLKIGPDGLVGHVASTLQTRYAPDVRKDPYYISCEQNTRSEVAIPLLVGERLVGVFTASHPEVDGFPRQQLRFLQAFCDHVAVAIVNAHRFRLERAERAALDCEAQGFAWLDAENAVDSVLAFARFGEKENDVAAVVCNFTPVVRHDYRLGVPRAGRWRERLNTDAAAYGGSGVGKYPPPELRRLLTGTIASANPFITELEEGLSGAASPRDLETMFQLIYMRFAEPRADPGADRAVRPARGRRDRALD